MFDLEKIEVVFRKTRTGNSPGQFNYKLPINFAVSLLVIWEMCDL